ncbi:PepSY-like domain-containing protein [Paludisphaera mucosa]|uniref:PepSY-like domain-containing protein n=1 Tax=Paludisphaera mucosa TaxID=3030827 RepID=A0ABT6F8L3_9BACT|nr:PepSY-like domain-containing protein [Paludisphaera mucosa]MDG3003930.1 PepSY-like domain-containing protein [Paludisphaera mucosa]
MRTLILKALGAILLTIPAGSSSAAADDEAPKAVLDAIKAKFPKAEITHVEKEEEDEETIYEISLKDGDSRHDVDVRPDGRIEAIETEIKTSDLPKPVADLVAAKYPGKAVKKTEKVVEFEKDREVTTYEVEVSVDGKTQEIEATPDGKIVDEDDDDDDEDDDA